MSQRQLSVCEPLAAYAEQQAQARGFTGVSAFVEHLLEADRREASRMQIEQALASDWHPSPSKSPRIGGPRGEN